VDKRNPNITFKSNSNNNNIVIDYELKLNRAVQKLVKEKKGGVNKDLIILLLLFYSTRSFDQKFISTNRYRTISMSIVSIDLPVA